MNSSLGIEDFLRLAKYVPVIDVRSPTEFEQGHIPGAVNLPLFNNEERARVGTAYVQLSREEAIKIGYEIANPKISSFLSETGKIAVDKKILVYCWRGGMRSGKFAQLLSEHGFETHKLIEGYKAYRNFVLKSFTNQADILVVGGETGSGKTEILKYIAAKGEQVIDLEAIAHHKGSAFGALGEKPQPTYEHFENELFAAFSKIDVSRRIWLEDESRNIGRTQIPPALWHKMKKAPIIRLSVPKKFRVERLLSDYGNFSRVELMESILKIKRRLGPQHVKQALEELEKGNLHAVADIALIYYDKAYNYHYETRSMKDILVVECNSADAKMNADKVLDFVNAKLKRDHV